MRLSRQKRARKPSAFAPAVGVKPPPTKSSTPASPQSINAPSQLTKSRPSSNPIKAAVVHFISGGLAAGFVRASLQPLDTCKTRLQATRATNLTFRSMSKLFFADGIPGLYRGVIPGVIGIVPAAAVYMLTFQSLKNQLAKRFPRRKNDVVIALSAGIGDVAASVVRVPCEVLKQRLQVGIYTDIRHALTTIAGSGSLTRLYVGLPAQLARDVPYAAAEFVMYENLKAAVLRRRKPTELSKAHGPAAARIQQRLQDGKLGRGQSFYVGGLSGAIAAIVSNPMDVVKTRLMTQIRQGGSTRYRGVSHALVTIWREEGTRAFARGIAPRIAAKTLQSALFFAAYETLRRSLSGVMGVEGKVAASAH